MGKSHKVKNTEQGTTKKVPAYSRKTRRQIVKEVREQVNIYKTKDTHTYE